MAMGKNKTPIYGSRGVNMDNANGAGFKATALRLISRSTTPRSRGLNSLRHLPPTQVSKTQPISRNGDGIAPLHYGYPAALTRNNALNTSTFGTSPPMLEEEESMMKASVAGFENRMAQEGRKVGQFSAWSPFDEPFMSIDKERKVISSFESLDCSYDLNGSTLFPRTLLSDNLNWPDFSHCLRSEQTPPPLPRTTSPLESLHTTGRTLRSGNIRARNSAPLPRGSYTPYYPKAYGHIPTTTSPSWNPYWPSYPNGQGSQHMVPPVPRYLPPGSPSSWFNSQNTPPFVPAALPYGSVGLPYHHGSGTRPSRRPSYPSVRPSRNIPPAGSRRVTHFSNR